MGRNAHIPADNTRKYILEKVAHLFVKQGFAGTSLHDLTQATGLTKGAIYSNFDNKDAVALAAFDYSSRQFLQKLLDDTAWAGTARERLLAIADFYVDNWNADWLPYGSPLTNAAADTDDTHPELHKKVVVSLESLRLLLVKIIDYGVAQGEFRQDVNSKSQASALLTLLEGGLLLSHATRQPEYIESSVHLYRTAVEMFNVQ